MSPASFRSTTTSCQTPGINLVKSASIASFSNAGTLVTYSYLVTNTGNVTLNPVTVTDPMVSLSKILCPDQSLVPNKTETCTATYTTTQANVTEGRFTNTAVAHGTPPNSTVPTVSPPWLRPRRTWGDASAKA